MTNIVDLSKLIAFADNKLNMTQKLKFAFGRVENIVGKGENAGYQHFLLFPQCFQKASLSGSFMGLRRKELTWLLWIPTWAVQGREYSFISAQSPIAYTSPNSSPNTFSCLSVRIWNKWIDR